MKKQEIEDYLKEHAPDIEILDFGSLPSKTPDDYNVELFGKRKVEMMKEIISIILNWLSLPEVSHEAENDFIRLHRESNFPEDVAKILKAHKAHPTSLQSVILSLQLLADYESTAYKQEFSSELSEITGRYGALMYLRKELNNTKALIWGTVDEVLSSEDQKELKEAPYDVINREINQLVERIKEIAFELLHFLEK